ncbi:MAG: PEP-utilizing enzyme, partial [Patescibacteria group bacterium]
KYSWLNYGFQGPIWTENDFVKRIKAILSTKTINEQLVEHLNNFRKIKKEQAGLEEKFALTKHEKYLFKCARILMFTKAYRVNVRHKIQYTFDLVFQELGKRFYQPIYFFRYARIEEIVDLINGKNLDMVAILSRRKLMLEIIDNGKRKFVSPSKIVRVCNKFIIKEKKITGNILHGHSAYVGVARGNAKLIFGLEDLLKVKNGDILITISTTPDLLPAMVKAKGFVTDQGGITSHAAIVAREMKKPCVIGTKFATKIFRDGDLVEVDANKGIVRKII